MDNINPDDIMSDHYDFTRIFNEQIGPLLDQVQDICREHKIPFMAATVVENGDSGMVTHARAAFHGIENTPIEFLAALKLIDAPTRISFAVLESLLELETIEAAKAEKMEAATLNA